MVANPAGYLTSLSDFMGVDPTETIALSKGGHERQRIKSDGVYYPNDHYHATAYRLATRVRAIKNAIGGDEFSISKTALGRAFWGTSRLIDRMVPARASSRRLYLDEQQRSRIDDLYRESNTDSRRYTGFPSRIGYIQLPKSPLGNQPTPCREMAKRPVAGRDRPFPSSPRHFLDNQRPMKLPVSPEAMETGGCAA